MGTCARPESARGRRARVGDPPSRVREGSSLIGGEHGKETLCAGGPER